MSIPTRPTPPDATALITSLRLKHIEKYGSDDKYALRIGHRLGVTANSISRWKRSGCAPRRYLEALVALNKRKDPFDYSYLQHEKAKPGNHANGKV